ncbi:MFS-type transporter SLC18B1-like protein [Leptotrombidium deliense]|uniref:MFS-type transporter SLC18B1-like protein n=1 Tax=Leptotrombidium deliense TaxID=299467 RepID=A0A443S5F3_9ACAR|nr:MFS-type transporter SLC18B1-like protein [Leptotrombidium deliense]
MFESGSTEICCDKVSSADTEKCTVSTLSDRLSSENFVPFPPSILVNNEPNSNSSVINKLEKRRKFTKKQWILAICIIYGNICNGAAYSLIAPFFPKEAEEKGLTPSQYGFVFAIYEIGCFVLCPIFGKMIPHLSPNLLRWSQPGTTFLVLALATVEMSGGIGLLIGPALGGVLYELGGFHLPFIGIGIVSAIGIIPLAIMLPEKG